MLLCDVPAPDYEQIWDKRKVTRVTRITELAWAYTCGHFQSSRCVIVLSLTENKPGVKSLSSLLAFLPGNMV